MLTRARVKRAADVFTFLFFFESASWKSFNFFNYCSLARLTVGSGPWLSILSVSSIAAAELGASTAYLRLRDGRSAVAVLAATQVAVSVVFQEASLAIALALAISFLRTSERLHRSSQEVASSRLFTLDRHIRDRATRWCAAPILVVCVGFEIFATFLRFREDGQYKTNNNREATASALSLSTLALFVATFDDAPSFVYEKACAKFRLPLFRAKQMEASLLSGCGARAAEQTHRDKHI